MPNRQRSHLLRALALIGATLLAHNASAQTVTPSTTLIPDQRPQPAAAQRPATAPATPTPPNRVLQPATPTQAPPLDLPAAAASGAAGAAPDPTAPRLSLDALVDTVLRFNPGVIAAERSRDSARGGVVGAGARPNPTLQYGRGNQRVVAPTSTPGYTQSIGVAQLIENPSVRRARIDAAESNERASGQQVSVLRNDLVADVQVGAYTLLLRQAEAVAAGEALALLQQVNGRVRARVNSGEAPRYELIKADAEVVTASLQRQNALLLAEQAAIELNRLAGGALPPRWTLDASLDGDTTPRDFTVLKQRAQDTNPELRVLQAEYEKSRAQLDGARAERFPGVTLSYTQSRDPDVKQSAVGISVQVPLFDRRTGPIASADAELARSRVRLDGRRAELDQQVLHAWRSLEMAQIRVQALSQGAVPDAEAALRVADAAYRFGERGILDVLDAQRVLRSVRAELLVARYQVQSAQIELDALSGRWAELPFNR